MAPDVFVSGFELCTASYLYVSHHRLKHTVSHDMYIWLSFDEAFYAAVFPFWKGTSSS